MYAAPCPRDDLDAAFMELMDRLTERRNELWQAYHDATSDASPGRYDSVESECWSVLQAALSGIDAEERAVRREYERRLNAFGLAADSSARRVS